MSWWKHFLAYYECSRIVNYYYCCCCCHNDLPEVTVCVISLSKSRVWSWSPLMDACSAQDEVRDRRGLARRRPWLPAASAAPSFARPHLLLDTQLPCIVSSSPNQGIPSATARPSHILFRLPGTPLSHTTLLHVVSFCSAFLSQLQYYLLLKALSGCSLPRSGWVEWLLL